MMIFLSGFIASFKAALESAELLKFSSGYGIVDSGAGFSSIGIPFRIFDIGFSFGLFARISLIVFFVVGKLSLFSFGVFISLFMVMGLTALAIRRKPIFSTAVFVEFRERPFSLITSRSITNFGRHFYSKTKRPFGLLIHLLSHKRIAKRTFKNDTIFRMVKQSSGLCDTIIITQKAYVSNVLT